MSKPSSLPLLLLFDSLKSLPGGAGATSAPKAALLTCNTSQCSVIQKITKSKYYGVGGTVRLVATSIMLCTWGPPNVSFLNQQSDSKSNLQQLWLFLGMRPIGQQQQQRQQRMVSVAQDLQQLWAVAPVLLMVTALRYHVGVEVAPCI